MDYITSGHMIPATRNPIEIAYYIPYHIIDKKKFRVVFDASCNTSSGTSLNDMQLPGPKLQDDLIDILIRFRMNRYAITGDIVKMFRQVKVNESHWDYQRIVWRATPKDPLKDYWLTVVVWGMTSASYNSVRALRQCAMDHMDDYPLAARAVLNDFYVDDFLSGANDFKSLIKLHNEVTEMLNRGGFPMSKWASNHPDFSQEIDLNQEYQIPLDAGVLGMSWTPETDKFRIKVTNDFCIENHNATKRQVVSKVAKIYDPSGLVSPAIIPGRILIQDIWRAKIDWDEIINNELLIRWNDFLKSIIDLHAIEISRWTGYDPDTCHEWHFFSDASEKAYGVAVYLRAIDKNGTISCHLITSKSRVTPVKTLSIPRLELSAAKLAAALANHFRETPNLDMETCHFWTDSTIVLHWIAKDTGGLKPFVANRIAAIQRFTNKEQWHHVASECNPADLLSRGLTVNQLKTSDLWWHGPKWLQQQLILPTKRKETMTLNSAQLDIDEAESKGVKSQTRFTKIKPSIGIQHPDVTVYIAP